MVIPGLRTFIDFIPAILIVVGTLTIVHFTTKQREKDVKALMDSIRRNSTKLTYTLNKEGTAMVLTKVEKGENA